MPDPRQIDPSSGGTGHPPSEPRPDRGARDFGAGYDRPARLQMVVALVLGLVLVAIPLYLWRRPRAESPIVAAQPDAEAAPIATNVDGDAGPPDDAGAGLALTDPRVLECHDPGSRHTPAEQCDHLVDFEKLFAKAINDAASCVPTTPGGGTLAYVADVSFGRKKQPVHLTTTKDLRSLKSAKVTAACVAAVKKNLASVGLDGMKHEHSRYKIAITATYPGK
jgi:hypothetical protein